MKTYKDIAAEQEKEAGFKFDYAPLLDLFILKIPSNPVVVELGTFMGCASTYLARRNDVPRVYTVDTFEPYAGVKDVFMRAALNFKACGIKSKVHMLSCRSWEAAQLFDDKTVDLVWVDAGHDYLSVRADIEAWAPKIKLGGILAGHDYSEPAVARAVDQFAFESKRTPTIWKDSGWFSWYFDF